MRKALQILVSLSLSGCLFGASRGQTTTTFVDDPGNGPVHRQTYATNSSGMNVGGSVPFMMGAGGMMYAGGGMYGGGMMVGGGSTACVLHPDRCAVIQTATVVQPISISSSGGYAGGGNPNIGQGQAGTAAETDDSELTAMLARHEKQISKLKGVAKESGRHVCQILVADPDIIADKDERKDVVDSCQDYLAKHPYAKTTDTEAK